MPEMTMDQLRERVKSEHSKLYLVVMQPTDKYDIASEEGRETMRRHLSWQFSMEDRGILLGAGPFNTLGEAQTQQQFRAKAAEHSHMLNGSGMYIIGAASLERVEPNTTLPRSRSPSARGFAFTPDASSPVRMPGGTSAASKPTRK